MPIKSSPVICLHLFVAIMAPTRRGEARRANVMPCGRRKGLLAGECKVRDEASKRKVMR